MTQSIPLPKSPQSASVLLSLCKDTAMYWCKLNSAVIIGEGPILNHLFLRPSIPPLPWCSIFPNKRNDRQVGARQQNAEKIDGTKRENDGIASFHFLFVPSLFFNDSHTVEQMEKWSLIKHDTNISQKPVVWHSARGELFTRCSWYQLNSFFAAIPRRKREHVRAAFLPRSQNSPW